MRANTTFAIGLLTVVLLPGCTRSCTELLGTYPPPDIVMIGVEPTDIPHMAWECPGYNSDSMGPEPVIAVDSQVTIEVSLEEGTTVDLRIDNESVPVDPAPTAGDNSWTLDLAPDDEEVLARLCSIDDACAVYVADLDHR